MCVQCDESLYVALCSSLDCLGAVVAFSSMADAEELLDLQVAENDGRRTCDPSISVKDLEDALEAYFTKVGYRNIQETLDAIKGAGITSRTAPKAGASDLV